MTPPPDYAETVARVEAWLWNSRYIIGTAEPVRDLLSLVRQQRGTMERIMPKVCDLCSHHGSSPESIEGFDRSGEDQWIADLWREAALAARKERADG